MGRYRAAVIGLGRIASTIDDEIQKYDGVELPFSHLGCYSRVTEIEVVGLADTWEEQRGAAKARWGVEALFGDFRQMLERVQPQIVSICTSTKNRARIIEEVASGGFGVKAIWAEKPLAISLEEADRAVDACRQSGVVLAVNCLRRWRDGFRLALEMVRDGLVGDPLHVQALGECHLSHNGSHLLTTLTMFAGARASWVWGEVEERPAAGEDDDFRGAGYVGFDNGVRGHFRSLANGPNEWAFDVTGSEGMIRIMRDGQSMEHWTLEGPPPGMRGKGAARRFVPNPHVGRSPGVNALYDIIDCMEKGGTPRCDGQAAREALEIAIATRESHRRGGVKVDLPLANRTLRIVPAEVLMGDLPRAIARRRGERS